VYGSLGKGRKNPTMKDVETAFKVLLEENHFDKEDKNIGLVK